MTLAVATTLILGGGVTGTAVLEYLQPRQPVVLVDTRADVIGALEQRFPEALLLHVSEPTAFNAVLGEMVALKQAIVSPGLVPEHPFLALLRDHGLSLRSDVDLFCVEATAPVLGCTGTNGKSTVTALTGRLLESQGLRVAVGGNLAPAALSLLDRAVDVYVLELSSFQLERSAPLPLAAALWLNFADDHLDYHGSQEAYQAAKRRIYSASERLLCNADDPATWPPRERSVQQLWQFSGTGPVPLGCGVTRAENGQEWLTISTGGTVAPLLPVDALLLPGRHNLANAAAALALTCQYLEAAQRTVDLDALAAVLRTFEGLAHRCELVAEIAGVRYVNDSKATNVAATVAAVLGLHGSVAGELVVLLGGESKGAALAPLAEAFQDRVSAVIAYGADGERFRQVLEDTLVVHRAATAAEALTVARGLAIAGDVVLLAPAAASFDEFDSYEARGDWFRAVVQGWAESVA